MKPSTEPETFQINNASRELRAMLSQPGLSPKVRAHAQRALDHLNEAMIELATPGESRTPDQLALHERQVAALMKKVLVQARLRKAQRSAAASK